MDTPNAATGLTGRQVEAIKSNWAEINKDWKKFFIDYFILLFKESDTIRAFFKTFDGMSLEDIEKSAKLRAHVYNFRGGLDTFVENLEDPECLVTLIQKQAGNHHRRGISADEFRLAFKIFLDFAKEKTTVDELAESSWTAALAVVSKVMEDHMKTL